MFGIGPMEFLVIAVFAVVFIGPKKLPEIMKQAARFLVQARRYSNDLKGQFNEVMRAAEADIARDELNKLKQELRDITPLIQQHAAQATPAPTVPADATAQTAAAAPVLPVAGSFDKPLDHAEMPGMPSTPEQGPVEHGSYAHDRPGADQASSPPEPSTTSSTAATSEAPAAPRRDESSSH